MGIPASQLEKPEEKQDLNVLQFATYGLQVHYQAMTLTDDSLALEWLVPLWGPKGKITVAHGEKENTV